MPGKPLNFGKAAIIAVVLVLVVTVAAFFYVRRRNQLARLTAEAPAQVTSVTVDRDRTRSSNRARTRESTVITYSYSVGGQSFQGRTTKSGDVQGSFRAGQPAKACYEPSNPSNSEIFAADHRCGG